MKIERNAVDDVSFTINEGEWIAIVGHNGSGKSTLANLMNGLLFPQKGEVRIYEKRTNGRKLMGNPLANGNGVSKSR